MLACLPAAQACILIFYGERAVPDFLHYWTFYPVSRPAGVRVEFLEGKLSCDYLFAGGEFTESKLFKLHLIAGIVDIDAD